MATALAILLLGCPSQPENAESTAPLTKPEEKIVIEDVQLKAQSRELANGDESQSPSINPSERQPKEQTTIPENGSAMIAKNGDEVESPVPDYRPSDVRPRHNVDRAKELGIHRYESKRLILYSDVEAEKVKALPAYVDQLYESWVAYFGPLPPNREGTEYQITGYLIGDIQKFRDAGMVPANLPLFPHGRHIGAEFWMKNQEFDHYRRHLLFHEATHCFMTAMPGTSVVGQPMPVWYLEGMAELFGTHIIADDGTVTFATMPVSSEAAVGFGRVQMVQMEVNSGRGLSLQQAIEIDVEQFNGSFATPYAWSWALCQFLDSHPRYQKRFREMGKHHRTDRFQEQLSTFFVEDHAIATLEWSQFIHTICYGFDFQRNAFDLSQAESTNNSSTEFQIHADRGWQATGIHLKEGDSIHLTASGQIELAQEPKPWISEPNGVTIRYANGRPIGQLLLGFAPKTGTSTGQLLIKAANKDIDFTAPTNGTIWLRVNDLPNELSDNTGTYQVIIQQ